MQPIFAMRYKGRAGSAMGRHFGRAAVWRIMLCTLAAQPQVATAITHSQVEYTFYPLINNLPP